MAMMKIKTAKNRMTKKSSRHKCNQLKTKRGRKNMKKKLKKRLKKKLKKNYKKMRRKIRKKLMNQTKI